MTEDPYRRRLAGILPQPLEGRGKRQPAVRPVIPAACIHEWSQHCPWIPAALRRWNSLVEILPQSLHHLGAQAKFRLSQSEESIFEIDQTGRCGIGQKTRRAGDSQTECARNFATAFFIENQQAGIPVLPRQCDRGGFPGIQSSCFLKKRRSVRHHSDPIRQRRKQTPQGLRCTGMACFSPNGLRDCDLAVKPAEQIQLADLSQAGQHGIIADDDHGTACRKSNEVRASARISSAECPGHAPCFDSTACASQRDSSSSILRTCSSDNTSLAYASAAKASRAARPRFWNPAPSSAAKSSGMFTVRIIAPELIPTGTNPQIRKLHPPSTSTSPSPFV
ncbi:MAG: hypothetical protein RLZZ245_729 [Verrucomicrobiota bacterium]